jgi:response regulator RpfG family c-di-GMP phosphodiesterase
MNTLSTPKVLVVDDKSQHLFAVARLLKKLDVEVVQASSGSEALSLTLAHEFCVAVVDVQMPEMSGYELVGLWRSNASTASLPVIFISGIGAHEYRHRQTFDTGGAIDFLGKPFIPEILLAKVGIFVEFYRQQARIRELVAELDASRKELAQVKHELEKARVKVR